jgi:hypothetical protein
MHTIVAKLITINISLFTARRADCNTDHYYMVAKVRE